jgi:uncharacterized protein (TIGR02594 family)
MISLFGLEASSGGRAMRTDIGQSVGRTGRNRPNDVDTVLHLVNVHRRRTGKVPLKPRKRVDDALIEAIEEYQRNSLRQRPTGTIEAASTDLACLRLPLGAYTARDFTDPSWLKVACDERRKGVKEQRGLANNNSDIVKYLSSAPALGRITYNGKEPNPQGLKMNEVDETAWCACFVQWCLLEAKKPAGRGARAESWKTYGIPSAPREGAITVIFRPPFSDSASGWHVGFYVAGPPDAPVLLGGNQGNSVSFSQFYDLTEVHYRWPSI